MGLRPSKKPLVRPCLGIALAICLTALAVLLLKDFWLKLGAMLLSGTFVLIQIRALARFLEEQHRAQHRQDENAAQLTTVIEIQNELARTALESQRLMD